MVHYYLWLNFWIKNIFLPGRLWFVYFIWLLHSSAQKNLNPNDGPETAESSAGAALVWIGCFRCTNKSHVPALRGRRERGWLFPAMSSLTVPHLPHLCRTLFPQWCLLIVRDRLWRNWSDFCCKVCHFTLWVKTEDFNCKIYSDFFTKGKIIKWNVA